MHGLIRDSRRHRQSARAHFRRGQRMAAKRAFTAARMHRSSNMSLQEAAESCGSNITYVAAAVRLLKSADQSLVSAVIRGFVPILAAGSRRGNSVNWSPPIARRPPPTGSRSPRWWDRTRSSTPCWCRPKARPLRSKALAPPRKCGRRLFHQWRPTMTPNYARVVSVISGGGAEVAVVIGLDAALRQLEQWQLLRRAS